MLRIAICLSLSAVAHAQLTNLGSFNPLNNIDPCGVGFDPATGNLWVYDCFGTSIAQYTPAGVFVSQVARPGESADDCDVELAPAGFVLNSTAIPEGTLLFINGESGVAEIYAIDKSSGAVLASLTTSFGVSHVVGGAYHRTRGTFFLLQDKVPGGSAANRIAEVHPQTGAVLNTFQVSSAGFIINYGDLDISPSGHLLLVSSDESTVAEFTTAGALVQELALPSGVSFLSGIALDGVNGEGWVGSPNGLLWRLGGLPACGAVAYCTAGTTTNGCLPSISGTGAASASAGVGFTLNVANLEGDKSGLFFYSVTGPLATPWGSSSSFLCAAPPTQRTQAQNSGGAPNSCGGSFSLDWNQFIAANPGALGAPFTGGETVYAQAWFRDPPSPKTTNLSNGLRFDVCP